MHPDWVRSIRDQCQAARVPFLFKQWGAWLHQTQGKFGVPYPDLDEGHRWPDGTKSYRVGKKAAGRLLDGRVWDEFPCPATDTGDEAGAKGVAETGG